MKRLNIKKLAKFLFVILIPILVSWFAWERHSNRKITANDLQIHYFQNEHIFITENEIKEIAFNGETELTCGKVNLHQMEDTLQKNPMIQQVQVYLPLNGKLQIEVQQKEPIARFIGENGFYMDKQGGQMPFTTNESKEVLLISSKVQPETELWNNFHRIAKFVYENPHLNGVIAGIKTEDGEFILETQNDLKILLGDISDMEYKLNKFIAFYQHAQQKNIIGKYKKVNLKFGKQVIAIK